ncbi:MAG TPA: glycosyltransferase family 61 protein [Pyrinomonadaceae bacterium]|nr:glycosyltransferase family 61 protein [Pyrinomonadaceae bacterium]
MKLQPADEKTTLRAELTSRRKPPVNLNPAEVDLFSHELVRVIPPAHLLKLCDVSVSAEGIVFRQGKMLPESFAFPHTRASWKLRSVLKFFVNNYLLRSRRRIARTCIVATDDWSGGYFHWLADVLPRLMTVKEQLKDLVLLLPREFKEFEYVTASLKPFGPGGVEFIKPSEVVVCEQLLLPTQTAPSGHYNDELIREVGKLLVGFYVGEGRESSPERVYISRARAPKRRIANEDKVLEILRSFDFEIVRTEELSFAEQVKLAARARYLISNHGAGLTNMLFMNSGASVLELRHANDAINNCYFTLAAALKLNYFYQTCKPQSDADPHTANLQVDAEAFKKNIELMLESG